MSTLLGIDNFNGLNLQERSTLNVDVAIGVTVLPLETAQNIGANDYFIVGILSSENSELCQCLSVSGNNVTAMNPLTLNHSRFEPVTKLFGNQAKVYSAPNINNLAPADSTFTLVSGGTINLDTDQNYTPFTDPIGSSDFWYKFTYFNSTNAFETSLADSMAVRGGAVGNYCSIDDIRGEAGFNNNRYITDAMIDAKRQAAQAEINGALAGLYQIPFTNPINPFIVDLTARLAAGLLLTQQFGAYATLNTTNGSAKLKEARGQLNKLQTSQMTLTDAAGNNIEIPGEGSFAGWPNDTTAGLDGSISGDNGPAFRRTTRY